MSMTLTSRIAGSLFLVAALTLTALLAMPAAALPPTPAEIRAKFDAGEYRPTLAMIGQALALKGGAAEGYDRYDLFMLKGECLVQLGSAALAAEAFEDARESTRVPLKMGTARGNEVMLRRSLSMRYVPKTGPDKAAIDVKPPAERKRAMLALRADIL